MTSHAVPLEDRLWARVEKTPACWLWTGATAPLGWYGHLAYRGKHYGAHRLSYELANGPIPKGMSVLHRCDTPRCVRPDHLFLGTLQDNVADAVAKDRMHPREANGMARLTSEAVRIIRREYTGAYGELRAFARRFGVSEGTVGQAAHHRTWRTVR